MKDVLTWTLISECDIPNGIDKILVEGEEAVVAYKTFRDAAIFTNKRIIIRDAQGLTGKKIEKYSIPYSSINMWSTENSGLLDFNSEVELWTRAGHIKLKLGTKVDVDKFDLLISNYILK